MNAPRGPDLNLVRDPWIPVTYVNGERREVSLLQLFEDANAIRTVSDDVPQVLMALIRLFLAILYRAYNVGDDGVPMSEPDLCEGWVITWSDRCFDMELIRDYLERYANRFDIFGDTPFYQVPGLTYESKDKEYDPISEAMPDVPKPEKFLFCLKERDVLARGVGLPEAARLLLLMQAYDIAGIKTPVVGNTHTNKGKVYAPRGVPATGWLGLIGGVFLEGTTLFETLMLNWVPYDPARGRAFLGDENDLPPWELPPSDADYREKEPAGPVSLYTWQSRRIRLVRDDAGDRVVGVISCYGDIAHPVDTADAEMMSSYKPSEQQRKRLSSAHVPLMPVVHDCAKAIWRGLVPILAQKSNDGVDLRPGVIRWVDHLRNEGYGETLPSTLRVHAQGMAYGSQASVITDAYDDAFDMSASMARKDSPAVTAAADVISETDQSVYALVQLARDIERAKGDKRASTMKDQSEADIRARAYGMLDELFRNQIAHFTADEPVGSYVAAWKDATHRILLGLGGDYTNQSGASFFTRRGEGSVSEIVAKYHARLNKHLGALPATQRSSVDQGVEGGES